MVINYLLFIRNVGRKGRMERGGEGGARREKGGGGGGGGWGSPLVPV